MTNFGEFQCARAAIINGLPCTPEEQALQTRFAIGSRQIACLACIQEVNEHKDAQIYDLTQRNENLYDMAHTDPLTGLGNRRALEETINDHIEKAERFAIVHFDIAKLKVANDRFGQKKGDDFITTFADILTSVRESDVPVRLNTKRRLWNRIRTGGDEFVAVIKINSEEEQQTAAILRRDSGELTTDKRTVLTPEEQVTGFTNRIVGMFKNNKQVIDHNASLPPKLHLSAKYGWTVCDPSINPDINIEDELHAANPKDLSVKRTYISQRLGRVLKRHF